MYNYKIKKSFFSPEMPKARARRGGDGVKGVYGVYKDIYLISNATLKSNCSKL